MKAIAVSLSKTDINTCFAKAIRLKDKGINNPSEKSGGLFLLFPFTLYSTSTQLYSTSTPPLLHLYSTSTPPLLNLYSTSTPLYSTTTPPLLHFYSTSTPLLLHFYSTSTPPLLHSTPQSSISQKSHPFFYVLQHILMQSFVGFKKKM